MKRVWGPGVVASVFLLGAVVLGWAGTAQAATITSPGPLTSIGTTTDLNCSVNHAGDTDGEWFGNTACGTFVAVAGTLYGPADVPAGGNLDSMTPHVAWTAGSQTTGGTGTAGDPFTITTVVTGGTAVQVTQVDTYVVGQESYLTTVTVKNLATDSHALRLYRAGDCFLANSDTGFGRIDPVSAGSAPTCVGVDPNDSTMPGTRIEQLLPLTSGSHYVEDHFSTVWGDVGSQNDLPNTCTCTQNLDNGAAINWSFTLSGGASQTFSHLSVFSPTGQTPVVASKTADAAAATPGMQDGYTVNFHNANTAAVTLTSVTDTLPSGFTYVNNSTTGGTTANPTGTTGTLAWTGPFTVPAGGDFHFHFNVTVATTPGHYTNSVTGASSTQSVAPAMNTAPIDVATVLPTPAFPLEGLPVAAAVVALVAGGWAWSRRRRSTVRLP